MISAARSVGASIKPGAASPRNGLENRVMVETIIESVPLLDKEVK